MAVTKTTDFLPTVFQTDANKKFLGATLDQLVTEPNLSPINGYVGRKFAPGYSGIDTYVRENTAFRADYQLEPTVVYKNADTSEVEFSKTYPETLQKIAYFGGNVSNQNNLWQSDYYSYNPRFNADAFINFSQYYWVPNGPDAVNVFAGGIDLEKKFYIYPDNNVKTYNVSGYGLTPSPDLVLGRKGSYEFVVNQPGKPFWIQTEPGLSGKNSKTNLSTRQILGVTNNGIDVGTITFEVPTTIAQDFYITMPLLQTVDLVSTVSYASLQGKLLSDIKAEYGGIDGQISNLAGKYLIFGTYSTNIADWTSDSTIVPITQRYGIWQILLTPSGADFLINLVAYIPIPVNNKVIVLSGVNYGNTEWFYNADSRLEQIPVITATLDTLYYQDGVDVEQYGIIRLVEPTNNYIDIESEILGKTNYVSPNGVTFTNGLKIVFDSAVTPESYKNKEYYIDGVGSAIKLISVDDLVINAPVSKNNYRPQQNFVLYANASLNQAADQLTVSTTNFPDGVNVLTGSFPNTNNPIPIAQQDIKFKYPYRAGTNQSGEHQSIRFSGETIGITLPGILINGISNGVTVRGSNDTIWHYDVNQMLINGQDQYGGQTIDGGKYVYTNGNFISANAWGSISGFSSGYVDPATGHSKLIGFSADGYPIYGPFGYLNPNTAASGSVRMTSSYTYGDITSSNRPQPKTITVTSNVTSSNYITVNSSFGINPGMRATIGGNSVWVIDNSLKTTEGLPEYIGPINQIKLSSNVTVSTGQVISFAFLPGAFIEDYVYEPNSGSLDQYNGRYCVTPEFPEGTYAYFITDSFGGEIGYPYIIGPQFYGDTTLDTNSSLNTPDYIIINRASQDLNPWTRRNRWFHQNILELTSTYNGTTLTLDSNYRAKRPIIEFDPDIQLLNFGKIAKKPVDLFDTTTNDPFLSIEGSEGFYVDGTNLVDGMRVVFSLDQDPLTRNKIWTVNFIDQDASTSTPKIIHLVEAEDAEILDYDVVSAFNGIRNAEKSFWLLNNIWREGQNKSGINQTPYFDVFDDTSTSFSDLTKYPSVKTSTKFSGTKLFGYRLGTGSADSVLGFPLAYKNLNNIGDIQFTNYFDIDTFQYSSNSVAVTKKVNSGFLHRNNPDRTFEKLNVWTNTNSPTRQMQDLAFVYDGIDNSFRLDIKPELASVKPNFLVYVNYKKLAIDKFQLYNIPNDYLLLNINKTEINKNDRIDVLIYNPSKTSNIGFYQIPDNLNYNPQNSVLDNPTLGEMRNHIGTVAENNLFFSGSYPGRSNLRDLQIENQSGIMLQHSAPVTFANMFLNSDKFNAVNGILYAQSEYNKFKSKFLNIAGSIPITSANDVPGAVNYILKTINQVKNSTFPWFYSDMIAYQGTRNVINYTIFNPLQRSYEITNIFSLSEITSKSILLYLNNVQLVHGRDYVFLADSTGVQITDAITLQIGDKLVIVEYDSTDGSYIPETPTKIGLYPKFIPEIYVDRTYTTPQTLLRGHDGSVMPIFGDLRDNLLLELEKRIYNNLKVEYSDKLVNIFETIPGKFRNTGYRLTEFNAALAASYLRWTSQNNLDYVNNDTFQNDNAFSYNYALAYDKINNELLPGSWRACYQYFYDCQDPNINPWKMLGFTIKPDWWEEVYGPAPYTSGNSILWTDLENGYIARGYRSGFDPLFKRPGLSSIIPVNENGKLIPPLPLLTSKFDSNTFNRSWNIGQFSPTETAWRNSSDYPFALQLVMAIFKPAKYFAYGINTNKYRYNVELDQYLISGTNNRITQNDIDINGYIENGSVVRATGYLNYISDYLVGLGITDKSELYNFIRDYSVQLSYRLAGYSDKSFLKVLAEQFSPNSTNDSILIPDGDYDLVVNKSTPILNVRYSGVIIEKVAAGFKISGYDKNRPYFSVIPPDSNGKFIIIKILDGVLNYYTEYTNIRINIPYDTVFANTQQVANFLSGYGRYLQLQGLLFNDYDDDLKQIKNWELSTREFLTWVTQGWKVNNLIALSPVGNTIKFFNPSAIADKIQNSVFGSKVVNKDGKILNSDRYSVLREGNNFSLKILNQKDLIGYLEIDLVQNEHSLIFNNSTVFNDVIYNPIMGQRQFRLKIVGKRTAEWNGSVYAPGFVYNSNIVQQWLPGVDYMKGDLVDFKGFYYSAIQNLPATSEFKFSDWTPVDKDRIKTGLLSNFSRNAEIIETFYDINQVNLESDFDLYALSLIGYKNRNYLNDIGLDDISQVKFYQGFIKEKGTINSINALANVVVNQQQSQVSMFEDWAFRVGTYGSTDINRYVELVLDERYLVSNPASLEVLSNNRVSYESQFVSDGLYKTSTTNWTSPFLLTRNTDQLIVRNQDSDFSNDIKTAGFVNIEDVDYTVFDINDISTLNDNIDNIGTNSVIWVAKDFNLDWNVYTLEAIKCLVTKVSNALNGRITVTTDKFHGLSVNDVVMLFGVEQFNGFYRVLTISSLNTFVVEFTNRLSGFNSQIYEGGIYKLKSLKVDTPSDIITLKNATQWKNNNKVWVENTTTTNTWEVYNKSEPWEYTKNIRIGSITANSRFGSSVSVTADNNFAVVGQPTFNNGEGSFTNFVLNFNNDLVEDTTLISLVNNSSGFGSALVTTNDRVVVSAPTSYGNIGYVYVYKRNLGGGALSDIQVLAPNVGTDALFGSSIAMSSDSRWLYIGAPELGNVYVYGLNDTIDSFTEVIEPDGIADTYTLGFPPVSAENIFVRFVANSKILMPYQDYTVSGDQITFTSVPDAPSPPTSGNIVIQQVSDGYKLFDVIQGNVEGKFGYSVTCTTDGEQILVSSPYANVTVNSNTYATSGNISIYNRSIDSYISQSDTVLFTSTGIVDEYTRVYIDTVEQIRGVDWFKFGPNGVQFIAPPGKGKIVRIESNQIQKLQDLTPTLPYKDQLFGYSVDICRFNCSIFAGAPFQSVTNTYSGAVYRYLNQGRVYGEITGTVLNPVVNSGDQIRINNFLVTFSDTSLNTVVSTINSANIPGVRAYNVNNYLRIVSDSSVNSDKLRILPGQGSAIADLGLEVFKQVEIINNAYEKAYDYFGKIVKVNNTSDSLVVASDIAATLEKTIFDSDTTTFDSLSTTFVEAIDNSGAVWIYGYLPSNIDNINNPGNFLYIQQLNSVLVGSSLKTNDGFGSSIAINDFELYVGAKNNKALNINAGAVYRFLNENSLIGWDSYRTEVAKVDINGIINCYIYNTKNQTIVDYLDYIDPAKGKILGVAEQNISYKIDYDPAVYNVTTIPEVANDSDLCWGSNNVGKVWWDLSTVRYIEYEQGSTSYRTSNWGRVFPGSFIDVYEWVQSDYPPSQYISSGGDGIPKYGNNQAYVTESYIDPNTNFAVVKYYYWVKNKTTVNLNNANRTLPIASIAGYILDPKSSGIKYFAALSPSAVAVYNVINDVIARQIVLHLNYKKIINSNVIHNEYALLSEGGSKSREIPNNIFAKLVDSLSGVDLFGNQVPDPVLPVQDRYGIDIRPRQTMIVDRVQALNEIVSYVNNILSRFVVSRGFNLETLLGGEPIPIDNDATYNQIVNNLEELSFINIEILPVGYKVLIRNDSTVNNLWTIYVKDLEVVNWQPNTTYKRGQYITRNDIAYVVNTTFTSESVFNLDNISIYIATNVWNLIRVQSYSVPEYWQFKDWYASGFDNTVSPRYIIQNNSQITNLNLRSGDIVKILNNGQGKWYIIQIFANVVNTIAIQDGTIEFSDSLYDLASYGMGFDNDNFDSLRYDQNPSIETRQILNALKNDIFINDLDNEFLKLFFVFVNYILTEQKNVDWLFKTSFIDVLQKFSGSNKPQIYYKENQDFYLQYIQEVKPYKTTLRDYIVGYDYVDNYTGYVTDFDVPPYYDEVLKLSRSPSGEFLNDAVALRRPEYVDWLTNYSYSIGSVTIISGGSDYTLPPVVTITGSTTGNDAIVRVLVTGGVVTRAVLLYGGTNYITDPVITISGGNGTGLKLKVNLTNNLIRSFDTKIIYDRITYNTNVVEWQSNTLYQQGTILAHGGVAYVVNTAFTSGNTFNEVNLTNYSETNFTNANDRIQAYYAPGDQMPDKTFSLLEEGIDYPGVKVQGAGFGESTGFDGVGFDMTVFDPTEIDSDGTFLLSDSLLDTKISSSYTDNTLGIKPEDIIIDGGPYVYDRYTDWTANTSYDRGDLVYYNNRVWYTVVPFVSNNVFSSNNFTIYNIGPYASHAPEELVPGRVYDTLDITVSTFAINATSAEYSNWIVTNAFKLSNIVIVSNGLGYSSGSISVLVDGVTTGVQANAQVVLNANGSAISFDVVDEGYGYTTTPNVIITGANIEPIVASAVMAPTNPYALMSYRIFKDMNDNYTFLRLDSSATTTLAANLGLTDTIIRVSDAYKLPEPSAVGAVPGVVFINGERIVYYAKDNTANTLSQLRRGTSGTGARTHSAGDTVIDGSQSQLIIDSSVREWYAGNVGTGTINVAANSTTINGTGTLFTTELTEGGNIFLSDGRYVGMISSINTDTEAIVSETPTLNAINSTYEYSATVVANTTANVPYTFYSNTGYLRSNLWYARGSGTATNGGGLFTSNTIQVQFLKEGI
jgi:hypothetical protein